MPDEKRGDIVRHYKGIPMSNAVPGSARHAAIPRPHSAVAGGGTRQCPRCLGIAPRVTFYAGKGKCSYCRTCWPAYMRERYAAKRLELGLSYRPRHNTAAADLADCLKGWR